MKKTVLIFIFSFFVAACTSVEQTREHLSGFIGQHVDVAVGDLGKPSGIHNMQNGTWEYVWHQDSKGSRSVSTTLMGAPVSKSFSRSCSFVLVVNKQKQVLEASTEGSC